MRKAMDVIFILDRSGSMHGQEGDIIGGFNSMIEKQRKKGYEARVTTVLFNSKPRTLHYCKPLEEIPPMTEADYTVGGSTALLDALGKVLSNRRFVLKHTGESKRAEKTLVVIMTDGYENASVDFNVEQIRDLVLELQLEYGWEFLFIGADIDAIAAAADVGVSHRRAYQFSKGTDSFRGGLDAVGSIMYCISEQDEKLTDEDWDVLHRVFDERKKK